MLLTPEHDVKRPSDAPPAPALEQAATVRDHLAADRTAMANERTFLSYLRTSLALILTGASAVHLPGLHPRLTFAPEVYVILGVAFVAFGVLVLVVGFVRYRQFLARIRDSAHS